MNHRIHYAHCPVCSSPDIRNVLLVKDHTVSGETFPIAECLTCTFRFTQDVPDAAAILPYYKAESYISHTNTSRGVVNRIYQFVRRSTMGRKRRLVVKYTGIKKGTILDIGSGVGSFVNEMKQKGWEVTGLEPDEGARKTARELYKIDLADTTSLYQLQPGSFDAISLWHVLEHVHDLSAYMVQLKNLLKPSGRLFIAVPNYLSSDAAIYGEYWAAYDVPRHLYHFSPASMKRLVEKFGLVIQQYIPMWYDSFYISLLSSKYKNGKTSWLPAGWNGLLSNLNTIRDVKNCSSVIYVVANGLAAHIGQAVKRSGR